MFHRIARVYLSFLLAAIIALAAIPVSASAAAPALPGTPEQTSPLAAKEELRLAVQALNVQTELPTETVQPPKESTPLQPLSASTAKILLWGAVAVMLVLVFMALKDTLWSNSRTRRMEHAESAQVQEAAAAVSRMGMAQAVADDQAGLGDYAQAMHTLLLQSLDEMRRRLDLSIATSLTSREILRQAPLPPSGHEMFADIIRRVEISYFGEHRPGQNEYLACRDSFEKLTGLLRQGRPL